MGDPIDLAAQFEANRPHLRAVALRMLGSPAEADDAVQEAWLRLSRADAGEVANLGGWLTTVVSRVCLDALRARQSRREETFGVAIPERDDEHELGTETERETALGDSLGPALLIVLETLAPAERVAFVLHDLFDLPFEEIAAIVGRSAVATRQLASRARRRVQGARAARDGDIARHRDIVNAFLVAARGGNLAALVAMLDPNVVLRADATAVGFGASAETRGVDAVAATFVGRAQAAQPAIVDGLPALVWAPGGTPRVVFGFTFEGDTIVAIQLSADAGTIARRQITLLEG